MRDTMEENSLRSHASIALASEMLGLIFCLAAGWVGIAMWTSNIVQGSMGLAMVLSAALPTFGLGILLLIAGRILRTMKI